MAACVSLPSANVTAGSRVSASLLQPFPKSVSASLLQPFPKSEESAFRTWREIGEYPKELSAALRAPFEGTQFQHLYAGMACFYARAFDDAAMHLRKAVDMDMEALACCLDMLVFHTVSRELYNENLFDIIDSPLFIELMRKHHDYTHASRDWPVEISKSLRAATEYLLLKLGHVHGIFKRIDKSLYFIDAAYRCKYGLPCFVERPVVDDHGPLYPSSREHLTHMLRAKVSLKHECDIRLEKDIKDIADLLLESFRGLEYQDIEKLLRFDAPWQKTIRGEISEEFLSEWYSPSSLSKRTVVNIILQGKPVMPPKKQPPKKQR